MPSIHNMLYKGFLQDMINPENIGSQSSEPQVLLLRNSTWQNKFLQSWFWPKTILVAWQLQIWSREWARISYLEFSVPCHMQGRHVCCCLSCSHSFSLIRTTIPPNSMPGYKSSNIFAHPSELEGQVIQSGAIDFEKCHNAVDSTRYFTFFESPSLRTCISYVHMPSTVLLGRNGPYWFWAIYIKQLVLDWIPSSWYL